MKENLMVELGLLITPLLILPGVGILIMSTSVRSGQLHEEIHRILGTAEDHGACCLPRLLRRAVHFRNALVYLYVTVALLALAGLWGGIDAIMMSDAAIVTAAFSCAGILTLLLAAVQLVLESLQSFDIVRAHLAVIRSRRRSV